MAETKTLKGLPLGNGLSLVADEKTFKITAAIHNFILG